MHDTNHAPVQFVRKLPLSKSSEQESHFASCASVLEPIKIMS